MLPHCTATSRHCTATSRSEKWRKKLSSHNDCWMGDKFEILRLMLRYRVEEETDWRIRRPCVMRVLEPF